MSAPSFSLIKNESFKNAAKSESKMAERESETILVAEDDAPLRIATCRSLRDQGYTVLEAVDGKDALRLAKEYESEIHLILADTIMPGMGGRDAVEQISTFRPGIKSVYTSGYADSVIIKCGILDRNIAFLQKPYDALGLRQKVREALDSNN
jgi:response regulator RpfG family c-di-GMP phosphodiesterase